MRQQSLISTKPPHVFIPISSLGKKALQNCVIDNNKDIIKIQR